jgi:hypothetical protein
LKQTEPIEIKLLSSIFDEKAFCASSKIETPKTGLAIFQSFIEIHEYGEHIYTNLELLN